MCISSYSFCAPNPGKGTTKTLAQISPQQIVVISKPDDGNSSTEKKHAILLKQLQQHPQRQHPQSQHQRISLANLQKCQPRALTSDQPVPITTTVSVIESQKSGVCASVVAEPKELMASKQDTLQQLLMKHQGELKLQQSGAAKEMPKVTLQHSKTLPKQMFVVKQNQVAEAQNVVRNDEANVAVASQKQVTSPLVILNKQQCQQQIQNSKHQIIQLSGQQFTTQQIQQMLMKQQHQQQCTEKRQLD